MKKVNKLKNNIVVVLLILIIILLKTFIINKVIVVGNSMYDTFTHGDVLWVNKVVTKNTIERFDIVVINTHSDLINKNIVKRIIGLPDETIFIKNGKVFIDEIQLTEDYGELIEEEGIALIPYILDDDEYFVMGDNRNASIDSRDPLIGVIKNKDIVGQIIFRIFPLNKIRKVN